MARGGLNPDENVKAVSYDQDSKPPPTPEGRGCYPHPREIRVITACRYRVTDVSETGTRASRHVHVKHARGRVYRWRGRLSFVSVRWFRCVAPLPLDAAAAGGV